MNVSLTPELERYIKQKVDAQLYQTASEVVRDALRLLRQRDRRLAEVRREVQVGIDDMENGRYAPLDKAKIEQIKAEGRKRLAVLKKRKKSA